MPPNQPCLKHIEYRSDNNIEREVKCCKSCHDQLRNESLCDVLRSHCAERIAADQHRAVRTVEVLERVAVRRPSVALAEPAQPLSFGQSSVANGRPA